MTGRVKKSVQKGRGVDQLAERRRRHGQSTGDATRETEEPQGPAALSGPRLVEPPPPTPYSLTSALDLDDDPVDEPAAASSADDILDALPTEPVEDNAAATGFDVDEDEISVQLHRHHERVRQPGTGPQIPRGSAELVAAPPAARRLRTPRPASERGRKSAGGSRAAAARRRAGRVLVVGGLVSVTALAVVLTLVITGSSPHAKTKAVLHTVAKPAPSTVANAPTAALPHQLLTLWTATTHVAERGEHQAQQRAQLARQRTVDRAVRTRKQAKAQLRHAEAVAAAASSSRPASSTTGAASAPGDSSSTPSTTEAPTTPSISEAASSTTGSTDERSSSTDGSASPAAAGPTGVGSAVGCSPKCTPH
jgi:hypothetical protein